MKNPNRFYKLLFFVILAFYCLVFTQFSFENWDSGFVNGFSFRILQGEVPYRDFLYIRPPISVYFHALLLQVIPETGQVFSIRIVGYLLFALQTWFVVMGFDKFYSLKGIGINKWAVMSVCFIISVHNFFPDPWFTVDGLLFASAAFYVYAQKVNPSFLRLFFIALFCVLSALTKQSFYFVPLLFLGWTFVDYGVRKGAFFLTSLIVLCGVCACWLLSITTLGEYLLQVSGAANSGNLIDVGFNNYIHIYHNKFVFAAVILLPALISWLESKRIIHIVNYLKWLSIVIFTSAVIALPLLIFKEVMVIFFNAVIVALFYKILQEKAIVKYIPVAVLLLIGWCAALSFGYRSPVLFSGGLILSYVLLMHQDFIKWKINRIYIWFIFPVCAFVFSMNAYPYRSKLITEQTYSLEAVSPKLKFIKTDKATLEKHLELKKLIQQYGPDYITAPSIPLSHYLFDTKNPMPAEWLTNFEINDKTEDFLKMAADRKLTIFLEKSFLEGEKFIASDEDRENFSKFSLFIYKNCHPVSTTKHFLVYDSDELQKYFH